MLFSWAHAACTAGTRFTDVTAQAICRVEHNRGLCRTRDPFAVPWLVFVRGYGACTHFRCVGAALLLSGARAVCTAGTGFAGVAALAIAELSTTEAFAARMIRLLVCGLFSCVAMMHVHNSDAWVQLCCSAGRVLRAQLPPDSQVCGGAGSCRVKHNRGLCRTRNPFAVPRLVFVRGYGACMRCGCVGAALLLSGAYAACTAATGFTSVWRRRQRPS